MTISATATYRPRSDAGQFIKAKITPGVIASAKASADVVLQEARQIVPVDTGELKASGVTSVTTTESTAVGHVAFTANHAAYVEYGTGHRGAASPGRGPYPYTMSWPGMPAQPYLRPALDTARQAIRGIFRSEIALSLKQ